MQIAIDASRTTVARRTGTENYALQLTRALLALDSAHHWLLYFRDQPAPDLFPTTDNYSIKVETPARLWTHLSLARALQRDKPKGIFIPAHVRPYFCPVPSVVTVHDLGYLHFPDAHPKRQQRYLDWSTRRNADKAQHLLADSQATKLDLQQFYKTPKNKISVVYPGFDSGAFEAVDNLPILPNLPARYLLHVGTIQPRKNLSRLINAIHRLRQHPDLPRLVLAGRQGWLSEPILQQIDDLKLQNHIQLLDYVRDEDLAALYQNATAYVFPSLFEGFGFPALEAMASGVPVISSDGGSLPEVVGDAALVFPAEDEDALVEAILHLLSTPQLQAQLVANGKKQMQKFTWQKAAQETLQILEQTFRLNK